MGKAVLKGSAGPWVLAASTEECILGKKSGSRNSGKSERSQQPPTKCPECSSLRIWKDGLRYVKSETGTIAIQRYICRDCGRRFSETDPAPPSLSRRKPSPGRKRNVDLFGSYLKPNTTAFKANLLTSRCRVCDERNGSRKEHGSPVQMKHIGSGRAGVLQTTGAKNLAEVTRQEKAQREGTKPDKETVRGLLVKYIYWLEKEGYYEDTVYPKLLRLLAKRGANLFDPEDVKAAIAKQRWKDSVKLLAVYAYDAMTKMLNIEWTKPKYKPQDTLPFVPDEVELDQLIAATESRRLATYLQTLKETFADPGEILRLEWIDIDKKHNVISINHPVKGHNAGQLNVSTKLIAMLEALPKTSERVFPTTYNSIHVTFIRVKKRAAHRLQNPRLQKISFTTFRHWGGTMIAHYTHGNVLKVKELLRHKNIQNTMKYIHMVHFKKDDEFEVASATTVKEIENLAAAGFEKVDELKGIHVFRRPKRFGSVNG